MVNIWKSKANPILSKKIYLGSNKTYNGNGYFNKGSNGNNGNTEKDVVNMIVSEEKTDLELIAEEHNTDAFLKLRKIRAELGKCASDGKHLTKEQYSRWRVLGKEILEEYTNDNIRKVLEKDSFGKKYVIDVLSELNSYLRDEHKRLQEEIYHNTSLDIVLENRQRGVKQPGDIQTRLRDINGYLNVANEKNRARDAKKIGEIVSAHNEFFNEDGDFTGYRKESSETAHRTIKYMNNVTGGKVIEAPKSYVEETATQETNTKKSGWLRKMGKVAEGVAIAAASLGSIFTYATLSRNHEKNHDNLPQKAEVSEFPKINYDSQDIKGPSILESIVRKEIKIEDYNQIK